MNSILERIRKDKPEHLAKHLVGFLSRLSADDKLIAFNLLYDSAQTGGLDKRLWNNLLDKDVIYNVGRSKKLQAKATQRLLKLMTGKVKPVVKAINSD